MNNDFYAPKDSFKDEILHIRSLINQCDEYVGILEARQKFSKVPEMYNELIESELETIDVYKQEIREMLNGEV